MSRYRPAAAAVAALALLPATAFAEAADTVQSTGVSAIWLLANFSYAGMRAQNNPSAGWRIVSFLFGLPGTLLTSFVVAEGEQRAYSVDLPTRHQ